MLKLSVVVIAFIGLSFAYKQHSYVTHVQHIPHKSYPEMDGIQELEQQGEKKEQEEAGQGDSLSNGEGGQEENTQAGEKNAGEEISTISEQEKLQQQADQQDVFGQDYFNYPKYKFEYGVKDHHTGDDKSQWEIRDGDFVKGEYRLADADGTHRIVKYRADDQNGFQAEVKQIGKGFGRFGEPGDGEESAFSYNKLKRYL